MHMDNVLVSLSYQDRKDFERCLNGIRYRCESYFSGFQNLCSAFSGAAEQNQHVLLVDMKNNSTDVIMFQGDQPVRMKCYKQGLESILIESLSSVLNIDRADAIACMKKYYQNSGDKYAEIIGEDELPACSMGLKCWEIHEIIMGQLNSFIEMEGGISNLVMQLQAESNAAPRKLIITGEGACIPEIHRLFEKRISVKTEVRKRISPRAFANLQTTAYGMALTIAHDAGAAILQ
jgi:cell division ATPase FtsA